MGQVLKGALKNLIIIHRPNGFDWMNYALTKKNKYTYHHIQERKNGGKFTEDNGAILTVWSHRFLNFLEKNCPEAYSDLQNIFIAVNHSKAPMNEIFIQMVDEIIYKVFNGEYQFVQNVDLNRLYHSNYLKNYSNRGNLVKKIEL